MLTDEPPEPTPHERVPWSTHHMVVFWADRETGHGSDGRTYDLAYDATTENPDDGVCNALSSDGTVCRLTRWHWDTHGIGHMSWTPDLVARSGVYVLAIHEPGTVNA